MPFPQMQGFTFNHSDQQDALYTEYTAQQIKALFDSRGDELRTALNLLINALNSTQGASNIGTNSVQDIDGETIQEMLKSIRDKLKSKIDGSSGADFINATAIDGLTGETVQSLLESLKNYTDNKITNVKASTISADPIAVGSGNTVQAQLAWLLSQIAVAATGSIPDGSITEAKLAQAVVDKINKALANVGVLTTLLSNDKSSVVNAINEGIVNFNQHKDANAVGAHSAENISFFDADMTATDVKGAIKEVFTSGNNVKVAMVDALLQVDPSLPISYDSTWEEIENATGQISTGKKSASGVLNSSASSTTFTRDTQSGAAFYYIDIPKSALDFIPKTIVVYRENKLTGDASLWRYDNFYQSGSIAANVFTSNGYLLRSLYSQNDNFIRIPVTMLASLSNTPFTWEANE